LVLLLVVVLLWKEPVTAMESSDANPLNKAWVLECLLFLICIHLLLRPAVEVRGERLLVAIWVA
jgi:hypothetical protein